MLIPEKKNIDWLYLFNTLLGTHDYDFELEVTNDRVLIRGEQDVCLAIKEKIDSVLATPDSFYLHLPYNTGHRPSSTASITERPERPESTLAAGKQVLRSLFGDEAFDDLGFDIDKIFNGDAKVVDDVLFSRATKNKSVTKTWQSALEYLLSYFQHVDIQTIRRAWIDPSFHLPPPPDDIESDEQAHRLGEGLAQQCFSIYSCDNPRENRILVNVGRLFELIMPPEVTPNASHTELSIAREHLVSYLQQLIQDGVLFRVYQSPDEAAEFHARPIFMGRASSVLRPTVHTLIIDRSGSMSDVFDELKSHAIDYLHRLRAADPNAQVRVVFFDDAIGPQMNGSLQKINDLEAFIRATPVGGQTSLFKVIRAELGQIVKTGQTQSHNMSITFFSDGHDNASHDASRGIDRELAEFDKHQLPRPKIFTLGFGDVDSDCLSKLAMSMGNRYIHLKTIDDFAQILGHLEEIQIDRQFVNFVSTIEQSTLEYSIPVYQDNSPTVPQIILPMHAGRPINVQLHGRHLRVTIDDTSLVPASTVLDRLEEIAIHTRDVLQSQTTTAVKLQAIQSAHEQVSLLEQAKQPSRTENSQLQAFRRELDSLSEDVKRSQQDDRFSHSLQSFLRSDRGFLARPVTRRDAATQTPGDTPSLTFKGH